MRHVADDEGRAWEPVTIPTRGAHLRMGARLGFRPVGEPNAEPILTSIKFNSDRAAALAIEQMGDFEMQRRLGLALGAAGVG